MFTNGMMYYPLFSQPGEVTMIDQELAAFAANRDEWRRDHPGKFLLIRDGKLIGAFTTHDEALADGIRKFGLTDFLVRYANSDTEEVSVPAYSLGLLGVCNPATSIGANQVT